MIYIIEDDENIRNLVEVALKGSGYETAAFETAEASSASEIQAMPPWKMGYRMPRRSQRGV